MVTEELFADRPAAGQALAEALASYRGADAVVLGLARGGVPVAAAVAAELELDLDVFVVRKVGLPEQPELALGAVASGGALVVNNDVLAASGIGDEALDRLFAEEAAEVRRRERAYREGRAAVPIDGRTAILVDDGLATGASMLAAARALRAGEAGSVVAAVPVAPAKTCDAVAPAVEEIVCLWRPQPFHSVGSWYEDFAQTGDEEVRRLLARN